MGSLLYILCLVLISGFCSANEFVCYSCNYSRYESDEIPAEKLQLFKTEGNEWCWTADQEELEAKAEKVQCSTQCSKYNNRVSFETELGRITHLYSARECAEVKNAEDSGACRQDDPGDVTLLMQTYEGMVGSDADIQVEHNEGCLCDEDLCNSGGITHDSPEDITEAPNADDSTTIQTKADDTPAKDESDKTSKTIDCFTCNYSRYVSDDLTTEQLQNFKTEGDEWCWTSGYYELAIRADTVECSTQCTKYNNKVSFDTELGRVTHLFSARECATPEQAEGRETCRANDPDDKSILMKMYEQVAGSDANIDVKFNEGCLCNTDLCNHGNNIYTNVQLLVLLLMAIFKFL